MTTGGGESRIRDDIADILEALGLGDHARPLSMHEVVQTEILPAIAALVRANTRVWSDGRRRRRGAPAFSRTFDGKRCLVDVYDTIVATEREPDDWYYNIDGGEWANLLDLAEAIIAADAILPRRLH